MDPIHPTTNDIEAHTDDVRLSVGDPVVGKSRLLSRQCQTCIFKPGNPMHLDPGRLRDLVAAAHAEGGYVICHDTLPHYKHPDAKPAICRGFADRYHTIQLQVMQRLWGFVEVEPPGDRDDESHPSAWR
jgi:hypothetical protein